jgi:hypothetical protein
MPTTLQDTTEVWPVALVLLCCTAVLLQFGRCSPLYEDFFCGQMQQQEADSKQGSSRQKAAKGKKKGAKSPEAAGADMLLIHAGPVQATPGRMPLQSLLLERTVLSEQEVSLHLLLH